MPYRYEAFDPSRYTDSIGALLMRQGEIASRRATAIANAQARATEASGAAWGGAVQSIGQQLAGIPQQMQQQKRQALQDETTATQNTAAKMQLDDYQRKQEAQKVVDALPFYASGEGREAMLAALDGPARELAMEHYQKADEAKARLDQIAASTRAANLNAEESKIKIEAAQNDVFGALAAGVKAHNYDPGAFFGAVADAVHKGLVPLEQAGPMVAHGIQNPDWIKGTVDELIARSPEQQQLEEKRLAEKRAEDAAAAIAADRAADNARQDAAAVETARHNKATEAAASADAAVDLSPAGLDAAAMTFAKTGQLPALGNGKNAAAAKTKIINRAAVLIPDLDVATAKADYEANKASLGALQKQRDAISSFEETAKKNIDLFIEQAKKVPDLGSPLLNTPTRWASGEVFGSGDITAYNAARQVAVNEIAKITGNPNLTGQLSDAARHEVESFNPKSATLKQTIAVMDLLKKDMANRASSMDDQIKAIRARISKASDKPASSDPYDDYLKRHGGGGAR